MFDWHTLCDLAPYEKARHIERLFHQMLQWTISACVIMLGNVALKEMRFVWIIRGKCDGEMEIE